MKSLKTYLFESILETTPAADDFISIGENVKSITVMPGEAVCLRPEDVFEEDYFERGFAYARKHRVKLNYNSVDCAPNAEDNEPGHPVNKQQGEMFLAFIMDVLTDATVQDCEDSFSDYNDSISAWVVNGADFYVEKTKILSGRKKMEMIIHMADCMETEVFPDYAARRAEYNEVKIIVEFDRPI